VIDKQVRFDSIAWPRTVRTVRSVLGSSEVLRLCVLFGFGMCEGIAVATTAKPMSFAHGGATGRPELRPAARPDTHPLPISAFV
jgi:hypothetical protein